ncbi:MAG: hypothetical protein IIC82_07795 [Chloroflexi bacterium]|nr:hypothetical protein [Chloroflexota bacterium]
MPVIFNLKAVPWPSSSNKHGDGEEGEGEGEGGDGDGDGGGKVYQTAYTYEVPDKGKVHVTIPFVDRISITFPVIEDARQEMIKEMMMYEAADKEVPYTSGRNY